MGGVVRLVVVVEDDESMRRVLTRVLRWRGYEPLTFADPHDALEAIFARRPVAMTLDYDLGEVTGADLARRVRAALGTEAPPMILVSAMADRLPAAERELFTAVHGKPFRASALLDDVDRHVAPERSRSGVRAIGDSIAQRRRAKSE